MRPLAPPGRSLPSSRILRAVTLTMEGLTNIVRDEGGVVILFGAGAQFVMSAQHDASVDALYEQVRMSVPVVEAAAPTVPEEVAPGIRVLALRTPTLPPATRTNAYLVGPETGDQLLIDPGSPYPEQQAVLDG